MNIKVDTFGEVLNKLIVSKRITPEKICEKMGIKSQTTLIRIINNQSSLKKINSFFEEFIRINPLHLVKYEEDLLREALIVNNLGVDNYIAVRKMLAFVSRMPEGAPCICQKSFGNLPHTVRTLDDVFKLYIGLKSVKVLILNSVFGGVVTAISTLLELSDGTKVDADHYLSTPKEHAQGITSFINLLSLINHPNYNCYQSPFLFAEEAQFVNTFNNMIVAVKEDKQGKKYTDIISFCSETDFWILYNVQSTASFDFYYQTFENIKINHYPLKQSVGEKNDTDAFVGLIEKRLEVENTTDEIHIQSEFNHKWIPPEIMFGITEDMKIRDVVRDLHRKVHWHLNNNTKKYTHILTKKGIINFIEKGKITNFEQYFLPMTQEEIKKTLQNVIDVCNNNRNISLHFLKNDINYNDYIYTLFENKYLIFRESNTYNQKGNYYCQIATDYIMNSFSFFVKNHLIVNYCYSHEESLEFIQNLLDEM